MPPSILTYKKTLLVPATISAKIIVQKPIETTGPILKKALIQRTPYTQIKIYPKHCDDS